MQACLYASESKMVPHTRGKRPKNQLSVRRVDSEQVQVGIGLKWLKIVAPTSQAGTSFIISGATTVLEMKYNAHCTQRNFSATSR